MTKHRGPAYRQALKAAIDERIDELAEDLWRLEELIYYKDDTPEAMKDQYFKLYNVIAETIDKLEGIKKEIS